jgi:RimJ/RimL family protein N-acetyltransferase
MTAVRLRPTRAQDIAFCSRAERDPEARPFIGTSTPEEHRAQIDGAREYLIIEADGEPAGFMLFSEVDAARAIELARFVIADRGRGLGRIVLPLAIDHVFETTNVHRFWLDVLPRNERAHRAYLRAGFTDEGSLRDAWIGPDGDFEDLRIMSILRPEWEGRR